MRATLSQRIVNVTIVVVAVLITTAGAVFAQLAPEKRFTVYNGVVSIEGQSGTNDIMQLGSSGRDISSTGFIYIRPGTSNGVYGAPTGAGTYFEGISNGVQNLRLTGQLCLDGTGSWDCRDTWPGGAGGGTLDAAYDFGGAGAGRVVTVDTGPVELRGVSGFRPLRLKSSANDQIEFFKTSGNTSNHTFLDFGVDQNGSGTYDAGDLPGVGFRFWDATSPTGATLIIESMAQGASLLSNSVSINAPTNPNARVVVNQTNTAGKIGATGDALYAYADSVNSAISGEQANAAGYAGYFSGRLAVTGRTSLFGGLTVGSQTGSLVELLGKYQLLAFEAENAFTPSVGPTPAACLQDNFVTGGNTYLRLDNCDVTTTMRTTSQITLPAGNWKAVFRIMKPDSTSNTRTTSNVTIAATGIAGAVRNITEQEIDWRFFGVIVPQTFSIRLALTTTTTFYLILSPDIPSEFLIDSIYIEPDTDSFSIVGDHSATEGAIGNGSGTNIDAYRTGISYMCPPGYIAVGVSNEGDATSGGRAVPICARN